MPVASGYTCIFPKRDHLSVGVFQASQARASSLKESLAHFINHQVVLQDHQVLSQRAHHIPLGGVNEQLHHGRILLVSDAANLADPWLGDGISYAIASAGEAAKVMIDFLRGAVGDLSRFTSHINRQLMPKFREAQRRAYFVYRFPGFCTCGPQAQPVCICIDLRFAARRL